MLESQWQTLTAKDNAPSNGSTAGGMVLMSDLAVLSFTGSDVRNFLQGYLTCDTLEITADRLQPSAICNLQGRVVAFGWATAASENELLWLVPDSVVTELQKFLKPYLAFSKTRLTLWEADHLVVAFESTADTGNLTSSLNLEIIRESDRLSALYAERGLGARGQIDLILINCHLPWLTSVNAGQFLPQMLGLVDLNAVNFAKGCYLGQEVVARAQHRGQVKRQLTLLIHNTATALEVGSEIIDSRDKPAGTVIASAAYDGEAKSLCVLQTSAQSPFSDRKTGLTMHS